MGYGEDDILRETGPNAFAAGRRYLQQGRVLSFAWAEDVAHARVRGSEPTPYSQTIAVRTRAGKSAIDGECSCPVGFNCKHVAAALLRGLTVGRPAAVEAAADRAVELPPHMAAWLATLDRARSGEEFSKDVRHRVVYVLAPMKDHMADQRAVPRLGVLPVSARLLKDGGFQPANRRLEIHTALGPNPPKCLRPSDFAIMRGLTAASRSYGAFQGSSLSDEGGATILSDILATGRARWLDVNGPVLAQGPARAGRIAWRELGAAALAPRLELDGAADAGVLTFGAAPPVYVDVASGTVGSIETGHPPRLAAALVNAPAVPAEAVAAFNAALILRAPELGAALPRPPRVERVTGLKPAPRLRLFKAQLPAWGGYGGYGYAPPPEAVALARLSFGYGDVVIPHSEPKRVVSRLQGDRLFELARDVAAEREAADLLASHDFLPARVRRRGTPPAHAEDFLPEDDDVAWLDALYHAVPTLRRDGWDVEIDDDFPFELLRADAAFDAELRESSGVDWLELDLGVVIDGERIDLIGPIVAMIARPGFDPAQFDVGAPDDEPAYVGLGEGRVLAVPPDRLRPIVAAIRALAFGRADPAGRLRLTRADAAALAAFEAATADAGLVWRGGERVRALGARLNASGGVPPAQLPHGFRATLRPYQAEGVSWLALLRDVGLGGVLADDMGLGKTVQILGLLAIEKAAGRMERPALVVAPTSLMGNWRREAERFAPDLRIFVLHGPDRHARFEGIEGCDVVLTTYPLIARDHAVLRATTWSLMILDEAQTIKNPDATTTKLLLGLEASCRFCVTGTPLENNLAELWSLFAFACPGLLGDRRAFTKNWRQPIEALGDRERSRMLSQRIRPFLLRRTKAEVARDLPAKTEIVERIELQGGQRDVYEAIRLSMHARVRAAVAERGWARSRIVVLDALLKLRQACCDPRLLKLTGLGAAEHSGGLAAEAAGKPSANSAVKAAARAGSAKLDRLFEMLAELRAEGRRVLVFSQFTSMLDLIRARLDQEAVAYCLLTGDTRDRDGVIRAFEADPTRVFLVSLKAGGVGLNLTAADTVILYDPWWNPAVEAQAVDRAHRIGQSRPVFVHKLVAVGTIEEKMEALKEKKAALAESLFDPDGAPTLAMTEADLEAILAA